MIAQFNDNLPGKVLAGVSAGLLALLLLLVGIWLLPPSAERSESGASDLALSSEVPTLEQARPIEEYAVIVNRPVFNENRQPVIGGEVPDGEEDDALAQAEDVEAPNVELAGVVITPDVRVATLRLEGGTESLLALEGEPLRGDFGSWRLTSIEPRSAVLESADGQTVELKLQIHDAVIDAPPEPAPAPGEASEQEAEQAAEGPSISRAEEIRQRIAQRREELRRAAEEGGPEPVTPKVNYQEAIQSLMNARRNDQENDESEQ